MIKYEVIQKKPHHISDSCGRYMRGQKRREEPMFPCVQEEKLVPRDHILRQIDRLIDFSCVHDSVRGLHSYAGWPSVDPEVLIRMMLISYVYGIISARRLCREVRLNLAYRWFYGFSLEDKIPDHSTFSKNRHGRCSGSNLFRELSSTSKVIPMPACSANRFRKPAFAYSDHSLMNNCSRIILDVDVTEPNLHQEGKVAGEMVERVRFRIGLTPETLAGDKAYCYGPAVRRICEAGGQTPGCSTDQDSLELPGNRLQE